MPIWGYGCGMVDCSICAGVVDDADDQRYHHELAANRSGASKTCRPGASECSIERRCDCPDEGFYPFGRRGDRGCRGGTTAPADPFRRTFRPVGNSVMAAVVEA